MDNIPARPQATRDLLLVPTRLELDWVREFWPAINQLANAEPTGAEPAALRVAVCGFGLVAAAAQTALLIARFAPQRVWLLGIAGTYGGGGDVGQAMSFDSVACYGIGVGMGPQFQSAGQMGWPQWHSADRSLVIEDRIELRNVGGDRASARSDSEGKLLLSVAAASQGAKDVELRKQFCPEAVAEDMEGFAVAAACQMQQVPVTIMRGISNIAGDRDKANWRIREAIRAAVDLAQRVMP